MNKWWRKEDNYLHGSRCQPVSPGWGESSEGRRRTEKLAPATRGCYCFDTSPQTRDVKPPCPIFHNCPEKLIKVFGLEGKLKKKTKNLHPTKLTQLSLACKRDVCGSTHICGVLWQVRGGAARLHVCVSLSDRGRGSPNKSESSHRRRKINAGLLIQALGLWRVSGWEGFSG